MNANKNWEVRAMYKVRQSMLNSYEQCPRLCLEEWGAFGTPDPYDTDERPTNKYAMTGIALHKAMEYWGQEKMKGVSITPLDLHDALDRFFVEIPFEMFDDEADRHEYYNSLHEQIDWLYDHYTANKPIAVELNFSLDNLIPGLPTCAGTIDRIDGDIAAKDVDLLDYKSGKVYTHVECHTNMQATMYSLAFKQMYGFYPKRFVFLFSKHKKTREIIITPEFIENGLTRIRTNWYHVMNGDFNPPPHPPKYFCNHFCPHKANCPRWRKPRGWEEVGE
jgi:CRISPR/Cas system-associated exonuclease Cas4 (RecB family)